MQILRHQVEYYGINMCIFSKYCLYSVDRLEQLAAVHWKVTAAPAAVHLVNRMGHPIGILWHLTLYQRILSFLLNQFQLSQLTVLSFHAKLICTKFYVFSVLFLTLPRS